jgi:transposase
VIEERQAPKAAAMAFGVSAKTVNNWVERFKAEGLAGMYDRRS